MASSALSPLRRVVAILVTMLVVLAATGKDVAALPIPTVDNPLVDAAGQLTMLVDEGRSRTLEGALWRSGEFARSLKPTPNLGVSSAALWVRADFESSGAPFLAEVDYPQFDDLTFAVVHPDGSTRVVNTGDALPFVERARSARAPAGSVRS